MHCCQLPNTKEWQRPPPKKQSSGQSYIICCETQPTSELRQTLTPDSHLADPWWGLAKDPNRGHLYYRKEVWVNASSSVPQPPHLHDVIKTWKNYIETGVTRSKHINQYTPQFDESGSRTHLQQCGSLTSIYPCSPTRQQFLMRSHEVWSSFKIIWCLLQQYSDHDSDTLQQLTFASAGLGVRTFVS